MRKYLLFTVERQLLIDEFLRDRYFDDYSQTRKLSYSITSPIKKFLTFAQQHGIHQILPDPEEQKIPLAANELILGYISEAKNLRGRKSKTTYTNVINSFFT